MHKEVHDAVSDPMIFWAVVSLGLLLELSVMGENTLLLRAVA